TSLINASSQLQDAAWEFVRYLSAPEQQKTFALESSNLPSRSDLYEDEDILDSVPVVALSKDILENGRPRPVSPYYSDMSLEMAAQFHDSLQGSVSPEEAISNLQNHLSSIVGQGED
ncbi:MAG: ABC transporter substrate-binding protein, partial [Rubrobacteraceae bacterium]